MRDIDFEELDKAVGSYLENGVVPNSKEKNNEVFSKIESQIEHSREQQKMVFARKAPQSANQLHQNNEKVQIRNIEKVAEKPKNEKKSVYKKPRVRILDDFSAPVPPEHHRDNFGVSLLAREEKIAFESPILETYGGEKLIRNIKKPENSPIRKKVVSKNEKIQVKKETEVQPQKNEINIAEQKTTTPSRAEFYAGVYRIGDDSNKLRVFHGEHTVEIPERKISSSNFENLNLENEPEKVMPEISSLKASGNTINLDNSEEIKKEIEGKAETKASKIEVKTELKNQSEQIKENNKRIDIFEVDERTEENSKQNETSEKVIIQPVDEIEKPKTPFVQNPQIEKRPLGINQNQAKSFEFKKPVSNYEQKAATITKELRRAKMSAPILSSDEYSTPIKHKKKSGWGVVLAIIVILMLGAGAGLVAYLVAFR
jgi:hypothetical protein